MAINNRYFIDNSSKTPVYLQIKNIIKNDILMGKYKSGEKLSQRKIATLFKVSRMPVAEAFTMLESDGLITSKPQSCTVVANNVWKDMYEADSLWQPYLKFGRQKEMPPCLLTIFKQLERSNNIFGDRLATSFEPEKVIIQAMQSAAKRLSTTADWSHFNMNGLPSLRNTLVKHLKKYGIHTTTKNILVTQGVGESLMILAMGLLNNGMNLVYSNRSFVNTIMLLQSTGINLETIPMDNEGLVIEKLHAKLNRAKNTILYVQLTNHNPTGIHTTTARRNEIFSTCSNMKTPIIENDMFRDFVFDKKYSLPIKSLDKNDQIIYIGSLWSGFMGFKTSWIVASEYIIEKLKYVKINFELVPNNVVEILVDEMLSNGYYDEYMQNLSPVITQQYFNMKKFFDKYLSDIAQWETEAPAYFCYIKFNKDLNIIKLHDAAEEMLFFQGNMFDWKDTYHARINTLGVEAKNIEDYMKKIRSIII